MGRVFELIFHSRSSSVSVETEVRSLPGKGETEVRRINSVQWRSKSWCLVKKSVKR